MNNFEEIYKQVSEIEQIDKHTIDKAVCKLLEECGELAQVINKHWKFENVKYKITEESSDVLICIFLILHKYNIPLNHLPAMMEQQLNKWKTSLPSKHRALFNQFDENEDHF